MGPLECLKSMHTLFEYDLLHVQMSMHNIVMLMEVEKDQKPFLKIFRKLKLGL